jgi:hypothetical protein
VLAAWERQPTEAADRASTFWPLAEILVEQGMSHSIMWATPGVLARVETIQVTAARVGTTHVTPKSPIKRPLDVDEGPLQERFARHHLVQHRWRVAGPSRLCDLHIKARSIPIAKTTLYELLQKC